MLPVRLIVAVAVAALAVALAGCGGGASNKSLASISSCLKAKHFTVSPSKGNGALKMKGSLTVNDDNLDVLMTVDEFADTASAKSYWRYLRSTHDNATLKSKIVLNGKKKGAAGKKFDACV